jgi:hypothetical protein
MLKWLIRRKLAAYEHQFGYDASYMRDVLDTDFRAFMAFAKIGSSLRWHRDLPLDVLYGVKLTGTIAEDCGPCTQLVVGMALADKVAPKTIAAIVAGDLAAAGEQAALGIRFARRVREHDPAADELREEIEVRWGKRAVVSAAFAVTAARFFPTFKYALGYGKACQRIEVAGMFVRPGAILAS